MQKGNKSKGKEVIKLSLFADDMTRKSENIDGKARLTYKSQPLSYTSAMNSGI